MRIPSYVERALEWVRQRHRIAHLRRKPPRIITETQFYQPKHIIAGTLLFGEDEWQRLKETNAVILAYRNDEEPLIIPFNEIENTLSYKNIRIARKHPYARRFTLNEEEFFLLRECMRALNCTDIKQFHDKLMSFLRRYPPFV